MPLGIMTSHKPHPKLLASGRADLCCRQLYYTTLFFLVSDVIPSFSWLYRTYGLCVSEVAPMPANLELRFLPAMPSLSPSLYGRSA